VSAASNTVSHSLRLLWLLLRSYPVGPIVEPAVWVGTASGYDPATGAVQPTAAAAYDSSWFLTENFDVAGTNNVREK
jgi:hypothetical protein